MKVVSNIDYIAFKELHNGDICHYYNSIGGTANLYLKITQSYYFYTPSPNYAFNAIDIENGDRIWIEPERLVVKPNVILQVED
jgi:hypothetical protein